MVKIAKPSVARVVKEKTGGWYIIWYSQENSKPIRYRQKFGFNRIKDLNERQKWADSIISIINKANFNNQHLTPNQVEACIEKGSTFSTHVALYLKERSHKPPNTLKEIRVHHNRLNEFAVEVLKKKEIDFEDFGWRFPMAYQNWCYAKPREWSANYCAKSFQIIRRLLNDALEQGLISSHIHQSKKYSVQQTEVDDIALSMADIDALLAVKEFSRLALKEVRDVFVFACMTGLRWSDFSTISTHNFARLKDESGRAVPVVKSITKKNGEKVVIPLHPIVTELLKDNGGSLPEVKCNQVFNRYVKEVCELAGLTEGVILRENVAGKFVVRSLKKYEAVSSHTARRTFATIAYFEWKVPPVLIMKITGHKTEREFFKYIKISKEEAAVEMAAYFNTTKQ